MSMWADGANGIDECGGTWEWDETDLGHDDEESPEMDAPALDEEAA